MNQNNARVYDVFDTLLTTNVYELLERDCPELAIVARVNYPSVREAVDERDKWYRSHGQLRTLLMPFAAEGLERTLKAGYKIGVYSNGTKQNIRTLLSEGGIDNLFPDDLIVSVDDIGTKSQPESFTNLKVCFEKSGLAVVSFADDGEAYCKAAAASGAIPEVYLVSQGRKDGIAVQGYKLIPSVAEIDK